MIAPKSPNPRISNEDQIHFVLEPEDFKAFEKALESAPSIDDIIKELSKRPSPWKK